MKSNIKTFFFGSPFVGFTSYPPEYKSWVSGYDANKSEFPVICKYSVKDNIATFEYVEFGLSDKERSGRNFGIWLQIEGKKLKNNVVQEVLDFIIDFVNEILEEKEVFFKKEKKPHFYIIKSFKDVDTEKIIKIFNEEFIKQFQNDLTPIQLGEFIEKDLIVYEKPKQKEQKPVSIGMPEKDSLNVDVKKKDVNESRVKVFLSDLHITTSTIILLFLIILSFLYSFWNKSSTNNEINKLKQEINTLNIGSSNTIKPIKVINDNVAKTESKPEKETSKKNDDVSSMADFVSKDDRFFVYNKKLLFKKAVFIKQNENASFSSSDIIVKQINKILSGNDCKINSFFSVNKSKVKENILELNKDYLEELSNHIKTYKDKNKKNIPMSELKKYLNKDFIVLEE